MELPPTFTPASKQSGKSSLYLDEKAKDEFSKTLISLIQKFDSDALPPTLETYAHTHTLDAETFWKYNKGRVIGLAKAERDAAQACSSKWPNSSTRDKWFVGVIAEIKQANVNLGYLNDFKAMIAAEKQLQAQQKKQ
jgi:hypothetical protein